MKLEQCKLILGNLCKDNRTPWITEVAKEVIKNIDSYNQQGGKIVDKDIYPLILNPSELMINNKKTIKRFSIKKNKTYHKLSRKKL